MADEKRWVDRDHYWIDDEDGRSWLYEARSALGGLARADVLVEVTENLPDSGIAEAD